MRKPFISLAKKRGVPVRAVHVAVDEKVAFQRNMERFQRGDAPMVWKFLSSLPYYISW